MRQFYLLIPEKVDNELNKINEHLKQLKINGYSEDNLKEIISLISFHVRKNEDDVAHLKASYLRKYVPYGELYLRGLIELGVVDSSDSYQIGISAKTYKFTPSYASQYLKYQVTNPKLWKRIENAQNNLRKRNSKKYSTQGRFLKDLQIDEMAYDYIKSEYPEIGSYNYAFASATRIMQGDIVYTIDSTSHRFHSNLTNMPKGLRKYVTVNGVHLTNIDVKNCQPYLSTLILLNPSKVAGFAESADLSKLLCTIEVKMTEDVKRYIDLVVNGRLYEFLLDEFQKRGLKYNTREKVKEQVLIVLFDRNSHNPKSRRVFAELFPEVHRIFSLVRGGKKGNKFNSYQRFSILLQRIESHLILDVILKRIYTEHPDIIALSIHDSIMTSIFTDHVRIVYEIMETELRRFIGFKPKLTIEG